jgi:hypothetical protein
MKAKRCGEGVTIATVYCDHQISQQQSLGALMQSVLRQVLEASAPLSEEIHALYKGLPKAEQQVPPTQEILRRLFSLSITKLSGVIIILDALDEGNEDVQERIIGEMRSLPFSNIQIFCTSRNLSNFEKLFQGSKWIEISATDSDIATFVQAQLRKRSRLAKLISANHSLEDEIKEKIIEKAKGM